MNSVLNVVKYVQQASLLRLLSLAFAFTQTRSIGLELCLAVRQMAAWHIK